MIEVMDAAWPWLLIGVVCVWCVCVLYVRGRLRTLDASDRLRGER